MKKLKEIIRRNNAIFILGALFIVTLFISSNMKKILDSKSNNKDDEELYEMLMESLEDSDAKSRGLNEFLDIWEYEIQYLRDNFPDNYAETFNEYSDRVTWDQELTQLLEEIKAEYISDEDIYKRIKEIVPIEMFDYVLQDYLKAMAILREDLIR